MNILLALGGIGAAVGSLALLISNVSGACSGILSLLYCVAFIVCSVVGAKGANGLLSKK